MTSEVDWETFQNFNKNEFDCKCGCGKNLTRVELLLRLTVIRAHFEKPVRITSGTRCSDHHGYIYRKMKMEPRWSSRHLTGEAADIKVDGIDPREVQEFIDKSWPNIGGLGSYKSFTHYDVRPTKARWPKTS